MNSNTILYLGDNKAIRSNPLIRKPRSQATRIILESAPLTITEVRTMKGEIKYQFYTRSRKYVDRADLSKIIGKTLRTIYNDKDKERAKHRRYWDRHKDERNAKRRKQV